MKVAAVAERLDISVSLVYALLTSGRLRGTRHGMGRGTWRVSEQAISDYLRETEWEAPKSQEPVRRIHLKHLDV